MVLVNRLGCSALVVGALLLAGCGGDGGKSTSGKSTSGGPTFEQAATAALSRLSKCPEKHAGAPSLGLPSIDRQRLHITSNATLECGASVIFHWYRFQDAAAAQDFGATIGPIGQLRNPYLANGNVVVRVENARDVPSYARSLLPDLAADIKAACGCGVVVRP
jgi:hypothetical protein